MAEHLLSKGYIRAAGSVAGVVLEAYLKNIAIQKGETINKVETISTYNSKLKKHIGDILWGRVDAAARIRNCCDHPKDTEPSKNDVSHLISETKQLLVEIK